MEFIFRFEQLWWFLTFFGIFACIRFLIRMPTWVTDKEKKKGFFRRKGAKDFLYGLAFGAIGIFGEAMLIPIIYL
ncbi:hypothetical protein MYX06_02865 [Patescibacteria group bacterium AH-259-L05]|nr:hypothetical protein [Patescibacteria group bacterium AH-259-L05]